MNERWWEEAPLVSRKKENWWEEAPLALREEEKDDEEREERIFQQYARDWIQESWVPNIMSGLVQGAAGVAGLTHRLTGGLTGDPASAARIGEAFEQAGAEEAARPEKWLPENIARGVRGVAGELPVQAAVGVATGPAGMIAFASAKEMNQAIHEGQKAGLEGADLAMYVGMQGTIEAVPAAVMNKFGLAGFEGLFRKGAKKAVKGGVASAVRKLGIATAQELPEELITELGHSAENVLSGVNPKALNLAQVGQTVEATVIQTVMQMGVAGAPGVVRAGFKKAPAPMEVTRPADEPAVQPITEPAVQAIAPVAEAVPEAARELPTKAVFLKEDFPDIPFVRTTDPERINAKTWYHGTNIEDITAEQLDPGQTSIENLFGTGIYLTDNPRVAAGYAKARSSPRGLIGRAIGEPSVYQASINIQKPIKLEEKLNQDFKRIVTTLFKPELSGYWDEHIEPLLKAEDVTSEQFYEAFAKAVDDYSHNEFVPIHEFQDMFGELTAQLTELGYDALVHTGGQRVGKGRKHNVVILLDPNKMLTPMRTGEPPQRLREVIRSFAPFLPESDITRTPAEAALDEKTIALTKAEGARIRDDLDLESRPEVVVRSWPSLVEEVARTKSDENALTTARNVLSEARQITDAEHVSAVVAAGKLLNQRKELTAARAEASQVGNVGKYAEASKKLDDNLEAIDTLTAATDTAGTEIGRALNIRKLTLSRESFDLVSVLQELQAVQEPGVRISEKQKREAAAWVDSYAEALEEMAVTEEAIQIQDEAREAEVAQKVVAAHRPKKRIGRGIREKAIAEREDIKNRLRAMGHQIHDVSQVSVEGTYLIGRLGLTYVKEGAGTLVEIMERLRADMPQLDLTQSEVNRALIQRSPKSKVRKVTDAKKRERKLLSLARMEVEIEDMANGITKKAKKRVLIDTEVAAMRKRLTKARNAYYYADIEAAKKERAIARINKLQDDIANGLTNQKRSPKVISPELASLHKKAREIRIESRIDEETERIREQMRTGIFPEPEVEKKKPEDPRLQRKRIKLRKLRKEKERMIVSASPWTAMRVAEEIVASQKSLRGTADISFSYRQNIAQALAHPIATGKQFFPALKTLTSENAADKIADEIENSDNYDDYMRAGLTILDSRSPDPGHQNEFFTGTVTERVPVLGAVMKASARHAVAIGNLVRVQAFDRYAVNSPDATLEEMKAFADIANKTTGIGDVRLLGASMKYWNLFFHGPKFVASRLQAPLLLAKHWKLPRVRKEIAKEMVRSVVTAGTVLGLLSFAGAQVVFPWEDPEDPDWMKIRVGDTRIDIFGGFQQPARLIARSAMSPFREDAWGEDPLELLGRFAAFKVSPTVSMGVELVKGRTAVGEETGRLETLARQVLPFVVEDIEDAWKIEGPVGAAVVAPLVLLGTGASTYYDSETRVRAKMKELIQAGRPTEAKQLQGAYNRRNPKRKIVSVGVK